MWHHNDLDIFHSSFFLLVWLLDECGIQTVTLEPEINIVGGRPAQDGEWPWQVALYYYNTFICGGVLLSPDWIVTLGSCT